MRSHHGVNVRVLRRSIGNGPDRGGRGNQFRTGSPGALSSGGCGLARPIVPGCAPLLTCLVSTPSIVVMKATIINVRYAVSNGLLAIAPPLLSLTLAA